MLDDWKPKEPRENFFGLDRTQEPFRFSHKHIPQEYDDLDYRVPRWIVKLLNWFFRR